MPPDASPVDSPVTAIPSPSSPPRRPWKKIILLLIVLLLVSSVLGGSVWAYFVATDRISLSDKKIKIAVSRAVFSLPFIPHTPRYVLETSALKNKDVSKNSLDFSMVVSNSGFSDLLGAGQFDVQVKGYVDYSDVKNPRASLDLAVTKEFKMKIRKNDKIFYFKIDKVPSLLTAVMPSEYDLVLDHVLSGWISYDTSNLDTLAQEKLDELKNQNPSPSTPDLLLEKLYEREILPHIKLTSDQVDGLPAYKLQLSPTPLVLDDLYETITKQLNDIAPTQSVLGTSTLENDPPVKLSQIVKNPSVEIWIDKKEFYTRRVNISFSLESSDLSVEDSPLSGPVTIVAVLKLSDFGKTLPIDIPNSATGIEDFVKTLMGDLYSLNPSRQFSQANNTKRKSDINAILNAVYQYAADNKGKLPPSVILTPQNMSKTGADLCPAIVPTYMAALPRDPAVNSGGSIYDCTQDYDTGYTIVLAPNNRITISAPHAELGEIISITR